MIKNFLSPICFELWKMLDYPEEWMYGNSLCGKGKPYFIVHKNTLVGLWISNGVSFLSGYNTTVYSNASNKYETLYETKAPFIGLIDRYILWYKVSKVMRYLDTYKKDLLGELKDYNSNREH